MGKMPKAKMMMTAGAMNIHPVRFSLKILGLILKRPFWGDVVMPVVGVIDETAKIKSSPNTINNRTMDRIANDDYTFAIVLLSND